MSATTTNSTLIITAEILCKVLNIDFNTRASLRINENTINKIMDLFNICSPMPYEFADDVFTEVTFVKLRQITIRKIAISRMPKIPPTVTELIVNYTNITTLSQLPPQLEYLNCSNNKLTSLPDLPATVGQINCNHNCLKSLPTLHCGLINLYCQYNQLIELGALPTTLKRLHCYHNCLREIPALPTGLAELKCLENPLVKYPHFSNNEKYTYFEVPVLPPYTDIIQSYPFQERDMIAYNEEQHHDKSVIDMEFFKKVNERTMGICL